MVQLEVKLRIKHEQGSGRRRRRWREEMGWCRLQGEKGREKREGERGETGGERFTLFSDQRTEYRLERQKKERNTENKE